MVMKIIQAQIFINQFRNLSINKTNYMISPVVNYVLSKFEGNINTADPQGSNHLFKKQRIYTRKLKIWIFKFQIRRYYKSFSRSI